MLKAPKLLLVISLLCLSLCTQTLANTFYTLSDIHLNLSANKPMPINPAHHAGTDIDLNTMTLLLKHMGQQAKHDHPDFIIVTGDLVGHGFFFNRARTVDQTETAVFKTLLQNFPNTPIINVFGNNDSYQADYGNYQDEKKQSPYHTAGKAGFNQHGNGFISLLDGKLSMIHQDSVTGNFYAKINNSKMAIIGFNSVALTRRAQAFHPPVKKILAELQSNLAIAYNHHQQVILAMHVPPGINFYNDHYFLMQNANHPYNDQLVDLLQRYSSNIAVILVGHTHLDEMKILTRNKKYPHSRAVPILFTAALSTEHGNHSSFRVYHYDPHKAIVTDYTAYSFTDDGEIQPLGAKGSATYQFSSGFPSLSQHNQSLLRRVKNVTGSQTQAIMADMAKHFKMNNQTSSIAHHKNLWVPVTAN